MISYIFLNIFYSATFLFIQKGKVFLYFYFFLLLVCNIMKNIFILLFLWLLVGCQNIQNPQNTENISQAKNQQLENLQNISQNNENSIQTEVQKTENMEKEEKTENNSQAEDDCVFLKDNFCFSEWENNEKIDLWDDLSLQLSKKYVNLYLWDKYIESQAFNDFVEGASATMWYWDFLDEVCDDNPWCDFDEVAKQYPEILKKIIQQSLKEKIFYRVNSEWMTELSNSPKDIAIVGSWFYEYYGDLYVFDVKNKQFLTTTQTDRLDYVYKNDDFIVIQEGEWGFGDENVELTFFFKNGSTAKINDPSEGKITLKSVKIDENKNVNFVYQCNKDSAENVEKCEKQEKEVIFNKKLEDLFLSSMQ